MPLDRSIHFISSVQL